MRLEDWQKWLDSQFIDAEEAQHSAEASAPPELEDAPISHGVVGPPPTASAGPPITAQPTTEAAQLPAAESTRLEYRPLPTVSDPITSGADVQARGAASASDVVDHIDIPSIERYLPFLRRPATLETEPPVPEAQEEERAPGRGPAEAAMGTQTVGEQPLPLETTPVETAPVETAELAASVGEPEAAVEELHTQSKSAWPSTDEAPEANERDHQAGGVATREREARRSVADLSSGRKRARHARNVKPAEIVQELKGGGLWGLVPKHIQVLVAMGSEEVAQHSYKRSFKESRLELVNRLLDPTLSLEDTARLLNVCPTTVRRYTNRGLLTHQRTPGDQRRFKLSDVLAFLEAQSRVH
jgi:excisionase family DNA binding protein